MRFQAEVKTTVKTAVHTEIQIATSTVVNAEAHIIGVNKEIQKNSYKRIDGVGNKITESHGVSGMELIIGLGIYLLYKEVRLWLGRSRSIPSLN